MLGVVDDLLERFDLALAGRKAELLVHRFGDDGFAVVVIAFDIDRNDAAGEAEGEPVGCRPVIGALAQLGLQAGEQRGFAGAVAAAKIMRPLGRAFTMRNASLTTKRRRIVAFAQHQPVEFDAIVESLSGSGSVWAATPPKLVQMARKSFHPLASRCSS